MKLNHVNKEGYATMVDVSEKSETLRTAKASAKVVMQPETLTLIENGYIKKGDVLSVAQVAGIMAAKKTPDIIPMCHPLMLSNIDIQFVFDHKNSTLIITSIVKVTAKTGVEMEALSAVSIAALTVYDMCKAVDKGMMITDITLLEKTGGKAAYTRL